MTFANYDSVVGNQQIALYGLPDTIARMQPGLVVSAENNYWGFMEVQYVRANGAIRQGALVTFQPSLQATGYRYDVVEVTNTANQGRSVGVALVSAVAGQFFWVALSGLLPVNSTSSIAAGTSIGIGGAGQAGAVTAGKQIVNAVVVAPATNTVSKNASGNSGASFIQIPGNAGWFIGAYLSGTGIAAGTAIVDIDPSGTQVSISTPTTALVSGPVVATYNNGTVYYNVVQLSRPFAQGAIT